MLRRFVEDWKFRFVVIFLVWAVWLLMASIQDVIATVGQNREFTAHRLIDSVYVGVVWALATQMVIFFAKIIRINQPFVRILGLHFLASLVVFVFRTLTYTILTRDHEPVVTGFMDYWLTIISIQFLGNCVIYGLIVAAYYAIVWYLEFKDSELKALELNLKSAQLERQLSEANLTALRMQLNPHFLFNTLHSVASLIRIKKNEEAIETLSTLSELLRTTVYEGKANEVTVREEVNFVHKYLYIEQLRFSHRLEVVWEVAPEVLDYKIPNLLLQPLVENALKHGLNETKSGTLSITIQHDPPDRIAITVTDNGAGLPAGFDLHATAGVGLSNTLERLQGTYDSAYTFTISNVENGSGVRVELRIPNQPKNHA